MFALFSHIDGYTPHITTWLEYHKRRGFTHFYLMSKASPDDEQRITADVKQHGFDNVFIIELTDFDDKQTINYVYNKFRNDIKWTCYLAIDEYLMLIAWRSIQDLVNDKLFNGRKQILLPVAASLDMSNVAASLDMSNVVSPQENNIVSMRNLTIGGCKTKTLDPVAMLNVRRTSLPNGKHIMLKSFDVDNIDWDTEKAFVIAKQLPLAKHGMLSNEALFQVLSSNKFTSKDELLSLLPKDFPTEMTNKLLDQQGFIVLSDDDSNAEYSDTFIECSRDTKHDECLHDQIIDVLKQEYIGLSFVDDDFENVLFRVVSKLVDSVSNVDDIKGCLSSVINKAKQELDNEYKQYHVYPVMIKEQLDKHLGHEWETRGFSEVSSFIVGASKILNIVVDNIEKVYKLIMLLIGKSESDEQDTALLAEKTVCEQSLQSPEQSTTDDQPVEKTVDDQPVEKTVDDQPLFTAVDKSIVDECVNKNGQHTTRNIQEFAYQKYGVNISQRAINAILSPKDNLFEHIQDNDKIVFA